MQRLLQSLLCAVLVAVSGAVFVCTTIGILAGFLWLLLNMPGWVLCITPFFFLWAFAWVTYEEWGA